MSQKKFYLNNQEISVEISPRLVETLDESLDNFTIDMIINKIAYPIAPYVNVLVVKNIDDSNHETIIGRYVVVADNVAISTVNPPRYKHNISLIQYSQFLTKKETRNSVFSTSLEGNEFKKYVSATAITNILTRSGEGIFFRYGFNYISSKNVEINIDLSKKTIIELDGEFKFNIQYVINAYPSGRSPGHIFTEYQEPENYKEIYKNLSWTPTYIPTLVFDINGDTRELTFECDELLNKEEFKIPENIITWIKSYSSGNLKIYIKNAVNNNTFMHFEYFDNVKITNHPLLINVCFGIIFKTIDEKTVYNVVETLLNQQLKETADYNRTNDPDHYVPLFKLPSEEHNQELYDLLKSTNAPNFVFTQGNMYEALVEVFKLFDAIFTIDNDGYLDIEYYNEKGQHRIEFEDNKKAGRQSSLGEERYGNRLISYYQNTKINDRFPNSNKEEALAYIRSKTLGVPTISDFVFIVPKPIDIILNAKINCNFSFSSSYGSIYYGYYVHFGNPSNGFLIDITDFIVESKIWSLLSNDQPPIDNDWQNIGKKNCLSYTKGTNYITISDYYKGYGGYNEGTQNFILNNVISSAVNMLMGIGGTVSISVISYSTIDWKNLKLAVKYIALNDGKIVNESIDYKYDGGMIINQNNGSIDINKLGLNMVGLSLKLGQPTLTMTQKICKWEDRVKKGDYFIKDGARWVANICNYTFLNNDLIETTIDFVKNFNGLASRIELNSEKRLSNISNELTVKCEETYGEFIYYCNKYPQQFYGEKTVFNDNFLANSILMGFNLMLVEGSYTERYDATNRIVNGSITNFDPSQYTNKQLVRITGYLENKTYKDNSTGMMILNTNRDGSGDQIVIPYASTDLVSLRHNVITDTFDMNQNYYDSHDMTTVDPFNLMTEEEQIEVLVLCNNGQIVCGVVTNDFDVATSGWFDPTTMFQFVPQNDYTIEYASLTALDINSNVINEKEYSTDNIAIPILIYGSGNSVCFEMSFDSPMSAGDKLTQDSVLWDGGWFSSAVLYTALDGTATKFTIDFVMLQEELTRQFPKLMKDDGTTPLKTYSFGKINQLAYYKKPNEIFALNYQLHFLPFGDLNDCFLSNEYIKNNGFSNGLNKKTFQIIYTTTDDDDDFEYSIMDTKGYGLHTANIVRFPLLNEPSNHRMSVEFETELTSAEIRKIKTWAIVDEDNNLYFSCNHTPDQARFEIWFIYMHHRKEEV